MATTYNPYSDIKSITDLKGQWDEANKAGDTAKKNQIAATAQAYYDKLKNNGYSGVAQALSSNGYSGAKAILDSYAPVTETKTETKVEPSAYTQSMQSATKNNEKLVGYINSDRKDVQGKYDDIYNYANQDITKTDEYKSTYNNMMAKYDLSALQGRDNAVASGGSSNGGNIDSYSAANAMRQQAALTATGQQVAHQAGLDAYNARVSNVSNILNNLGIYNSGTYDAMNQVVGNDSAIAQQYFDNDETAKNNEVARLSEKANVTGYVPNEWAYENNIYLNSDGTVRAEYLTDEFDNTGGFTTIINNAKAKLATTTDATERANLQATIDQATQAKALKTYSSPKYAKWASEVTAIPGTPTEAARQANLNAETALKSLGVEAELTKYQIDIQKALQDEETKLAYAKLAADANEGNYAAGQLDGLVSSFGTTNTGPASYVINVLWKDYIDKGIKPTPEQLQNSILENTEEYNIDTEEAKAIVNFFKYDTSWINAYTNYGKGDDKTDDNGNVVIKGEYRGMKKKK